MKSTCRPRTEGAPSIRGVQSVRRKLSSILSFSLTNLTYNSDRIRFDVDGKLGKRVAEGFSVVVFPHVSLEVVGGYAHTYTSVAGTQKTTSANARPNILESRFRKDDYTVLRAVSREHQLEVRE